MDTLWSDPGGGQIRLAGKTFKVNIRKFECREHLKEEYASIRKVVVLLAAAAMLILLGTSNLSAQAQYGSVNGAVKDAQGASVPDAKVVLTNVGTNVKQDATTSGDGVFTFPYVAPTEYQLSVAKGWFSHVPDPCDR